MNEELLKFDGFDEAIIGVCMTWHGNMLVERIVYDANKIKKILLSDIVEFSDQDAEDHISYNMVGGYVGDATPIVMWPATAEELDERS